MLGKYNETTDEENTDPCGKPEYKKIKLGSDKWLKRKAAKDADGKINKYLFLEINLHNDQNKLTIKRSSMQLLEFFGAIGGMQRFVGAILS